VEFEQEEKLAACSGFIIFELNLLPLSFLLCKLRNWVIWELPRSLHHSVILMQSSELLRQNVNLGFLRFWCLLWNFQSSYYTAGMF
jgi:hypothetical protein